MYTQLLKPKPAKKPPVCNIHFVNGVNVQLPEGEGRYRVSLEDMAGDLPLQIVEAPSGAHVVIPYRYWRPWRIVVSDEHGNKLRQHDYQAKNRRVLISIGSSSLGDTLAWFPSLVKFQEKHGCRVVACCHGYNDFLKTQYPELEFVKPEEAVADCYATYEVGWYYDDDTGKPKPMCHPPGPHFREEPLIWSAARALGVGLSEERARLPDLGKDGLPDKPYVCIAVHSTAQAKYWNRPGGWQEVVDWLKSRGYEVYIASREKSPFMGNANPEGAKRLPNYELATTAKWIAGARAFIGVGSGLSWLAWSYRVPVVLISGFSDPWTEVREGVWRVNSPKGVCTGCFNRSRLNASDWLWCPEHKGTERMFECSKSITPAMVVNQMEKALGKPYE